MDVGVIIAIVTAAAALLSASIALLVYNSDKRRAAVKEGEKNKEIEQLKTELADARARVACLEKDSQAVEIALAKMTTTLERLVSDVKEFGDKLDKLRGGI